MESIKSTYGTMYYVDSMKEAVAFYKMVTGATPEYESNEWTEFKFGEHRLCLHAKRDGHKSSPNGVLILNYDGVKSLFEKMKSDGLNVFGLHEVHPAAWSFHMLDKSNNETSFYGSP